MKNIPIEAMFELDSEPVVEPDFDVSRILSHLSSELFDIDVESRIILGIIAKHGPLNEHEISNLGFRVSHKITRDVVRYRLDSKKNRINLSESYFLTPLNGKKIGNIRERRERIYHLLFKGFMASLGKTKFDECYLIKSYMNKIPTWTIPYHIPEIALRIIKFDLALFMIKYVMTGSKFTNFVDIDTNRESLNYDDPLTNPSFTPQTRNEIYDPMLFDIRYWFHVYSQVLNKALASMYKDKSGTVDKDMIGNVFAYINYWYQWLLRSQFNSTPFSPREIPVEIESSFMSVGRTVSIPGINVTSERVLKHYGIKFRLDYNERPVFFR